MSPARIDRLLERVRTQDLTYDHVGSSWNDEEPGRKGFHVEHRDAGSGPDAFDRIRTGLRTWVAQRSIGADVHPAGAPVAEGTVVLVVLPSGPVTMVAPCRVVSVVDEVDRFGFAYGTLPGHPERGEERFSASLRPDGTVRITIAVDATPGHPLVWLASPIARRLQRRALRGYLDGLAARAALA